MKAGWKTTEFWLAVAKGVLGVLALFGIHPAVPPEVAGAISIAGGVLATGATVGYSISRGMVKQDQAAAPPR